MFDDSTRERLNLCAHKALVDALTHIFNHMGLPKAELETTVVADYCKTMEAAVENYRKAETLHNEVMDGRGDATSLIEKQDASLLATCMNYVKETEKAYHIAMSSLDLQNCAFNEYLTTVPLLLDKGTKVVSESEGVYKEALEAAKETLEAQSEVWHLAAVWAAESCIIQEFKELLNLVLQDPDF